jgi:type IV secretory pathway protease TraF
VISGKTPVVVAGNDNHWFLRFRRYLRSPKSRWIVFPIILPEILMLFLTIHSHWIIINNTPSLDLGIYMQDSAPLSRNSDIAFCPPQVAIDYLHEWVDNGSYFVLGCPNGAVPFSKHVAAIAGDRVTLSEDGISINDGPILLGTKPLRWMKGSVLKGGDVIHRMPLLPRKTYVIPQGEVWAYTQQWFSLDSRYYGPIKPLVVIKPFLTYPIGAHLVVPKSLLQLQVQKGP